MPDKIKNHEGKKPSPTVLAQALRKDLEKILPGYKWTASRHASPDFQTATGIQSSGFNRLSTLVVVRRCRPHSYYEITGYGYGTRGAEMGRVAGLTVVQAVRELQTHYERMSGKYAALERALAEARKQTTAALEEDDYDN